MNLSATRVSIPSHTAHFNASLFDFRKVCSLLAGSAKEDWSLFRKQSPRIAGRCTYASVKPIQFRPYASDYCEWCGSLIVVLTLWFNVVASEFMIARSCRNGTLYRYTAMEAASVTDSPSTAMLNRRNTRVSDESNDRPGIKTLKTLLARVKYKFNNAPLFHPLARKTLDRFNFRSKL